MTEWTEKTIARLVELHKAGVFASKIATEMGITKGAVIGKLDRLNPLKTVARREAKERLKASRKPITFADLNQYTCRWPLWGTRERNPDYFFCGRPCPGVEVQRPYCDEHTACAVASGRSDVRVFSFRRRR